MWSTVTVSLRKASTRRTRHELTHLPAASDAVNATVTLDLSVEQTMALAPPIDATGQQQRIDILGDVRLVHGTEVSYFGPVRVLCPSTPRVSRFRHTRLRRVSCIMRAGVQLVETWGPVVCAYR